MEEHYTVVGHKSEIKLLLRKYSFSCHETTYNDATLTDL